MLGELLDLAEPVHLVHNEDDGTLCICCEDWGSVTWSIKNIPVSYPCPLVLVSLLLQFPVPCLNPELKLLFHLMLDGDPCALCIPPCAPESETPE